MKNIENINTAYGVSLEESASFLTQGNQCDWQEAWGGFRGANNC